MATFEVNTLDDEADYGATIIFPNPFGPDTIFPIGPDTSLREAIKLANDNPGDDTITFAAGLSGTIRLTNGEITITDTLTIDGGGLITITGDANGDDRGADGNLASTSGGITDVAQSLVGQDLLVDNSRVFKATADLTLDGLTITGGRTRGSSETGGGVNVENGALTVTNSTISGNSTADFAAQGGGAFSSSALTVTNSTISGNSTAGSSANGGGAYSFGALTVINSTISGNSTAGSGAQGGGASSYDALTVTNSIILGNVSVQSVGDEVFEYTGFSSPSDGNIEVTGQNIIGADSAAFDIATRVTNAGAVINASAALVFAQTEDNNGVLAGVLANNGGNVQTITLKADGLNPALDAATIAGNDARGQARGVDLSGVNNGGTSDLGAFELQTSEDGLAPVFASGTEISVGEGLSAGLSAFPVTATDVSSVTFSIFGGPDASNVSIVADTGVLSFNAEPDFENPGDENGDNTFNLLVSAADSGGAFALTPVNITITDVNEAPVAIASAASGEAGTVVLGTLAATDVDAGDELTFALATDASNGDVTVNSGGTFQFEPDEGFLGTDSFTFTVSDGELSDTNIATVTVSEQRSLVVTTTADVVNNLDGLTSLREAVDYANDKEGADTITFAASGQGVIQLSSSLGVTGDLIIQGGGLVTISGDQDGDDDTLEGYITDFTTSTADQLDDNNQIFRTSGTEAVDITVDGLTLTGGRVNFSALNGGGAIFASGDVTILNSTLSGNSTRFDDQSGGAVYAGGALTITNSTISGNSTSGLNAKGGGVYSNSYVMVNNSTISGNLTSGENADGGGVYSRNSFSSTGSTFSGNSTTGYLSYGGGVYAGTAGFNDSTISGNSTTGESSPGGGVAASGVFITNSTITGNTAQAGADGVYFSFLAEVENSIILGNAGPNGLGDEVGGALGDEVITVIGANIIGADSAAFDTSARITGDGTAINADPFTVFSALVDNNGVTAGFLRDNGGDVQTIALRAVVDNPALDAATIAGFDARGLDRGVDLIGADNGGTSDLGAFELQIAESGDPRAESFVISVPEDALSALRFTPFIAESLTAVTFSIVPPFTPGGDAERVSIDASTGVISFNEAVNFEAPTDADGDNTFEFFVRVESESGGGGTHTATITITDANDAPVAAPATASGDEDTVISGLLSASDEDSDALSFSLVDGPSNGAVVVNTNGSFQFTPVEDFNGTDSFTFRASGGALSDIETATITVNPVNEPVDPVDPVEPPVPVGPTTGDDTLFGTSGNDRIDALAGNDNVTGLAGDDLLFGRGGDDSIRGSAGDDSLRGNGGDDTLRGNGGDDNINGNGGADFIRGNGGGDVIRAGGAADNVRGGGGADDIRGGGGADTLRGNGGDDTLTGNGGSDVFQFRASDRNDTISDFRQGQDKIQIQSGARTFEALSIEQDGRDVLIGFGVGQVRVVTDNAGAFDESDFIF